MAFSSGLIDIVTPASNSSKEEIKKGLQFLKKCQFLFRFQENTKKVNRFFAQDEKTCFQHFKKSLFAKDSSVIWGLRGGYGSSRLLPYLDTIKKPPKYFKLFIGYSDLTVLHDWIHQRFQWPTLHFPALTSFSSLSASSKNKFFQLINSYWQSVNLGKLNFSSYPNQSKQYIKTISKTSLCSVNHYLIKNKNPIHSLQFSRLKVLNPSNRFQQKTIISKITGGNLTMIQSLIGTKWNVSRKNQILFLEDVNEKPHRVDRSLWQLRQSGVLQNIKALVFGTWEKSIEKQIMDDVLKPFSKKCLFPVLTSLPCGHGAISDPLLLFSNTKLVIKNRSAYLIVQLPF